MPGQFRYTGLHAWGLVGNSNGYPSHESAFHPKYQAVGLIRRHGIDQKAEKGALTMLKPGRDIPLLIVVAVSVFAATGAVFVVFGSSPWAWSAVLGMAAALLSGAALFLYRRIMTRLVELQDGVEQQGRMLYRQMEAYMQLHHFIEPRRPLPYMRGMAVSPDFALLLVQQILRTRPSRIVELGCGTSTLISSYCLERLGSGEVISIDHEDIYACQCRDQLLAHGLGNWAKIRQAPLRATHLNGKEWKFYDCAAFQALGPIDLLVIDGPPGWTGELARYPALPLLYPQLSSRAEVLIDDAARGDEARTVEMWLKEFPEFEAVRLEAEKGATLLRRKPRAAEEPKKPSREAWGSFFLQQSS